jgi:hypothetical protein
VCARTAQQIEHITKKEVEHFECNMSLKIESSDNHLLSIMDEFDSDNERTHDKEDLIWWIKPRAVVYAPMKFQGLAVPNLYVETGIQHVAILLQETQGNSPTGKLLRMSIEATKVEIGVGGSLFAQSFERFGP